MEGLVVNLFGGSYRGRRVLLTGHTGFKGSWLALWLSELGADVIGVALDPETTPNHWSLLDLPVADRRQDIRDADAIARLVADVRPAIVFHLAAQPLVRRSYRQPLETWGVNVLGSANVFDACRAVDSVKAIVAVTTDKCYQNNEWPWGYREDDRLGGHDPYSASKAGAELVAASYRSAFFDSDRAPLIATARAGNVIGGGDWSEDRLIPDLVRALERGEVLEIRSPAATRPWQHVLESLSGYLLLGQRLLAGDGAAAEAWNFGPEREGNRSVAETLDHLTAHWPSMRWLVTTAAQPHEATLLQLDTAKAHSALGWRAVWNFEAAVAATAEWYRAWLEQGRVISRDQLSVYCQAAAGKVCWATE